MSGRRKVIKKEHIPPPNGTENRKELKFFCGVLGLMARINIYRTFPKIYRKFSRFYRHTSMIYRNTLLIYRYLTLQTSKKAHSCLFSCQRRLHAKRFDTATSSLRHKCLDHFDLVIHRTKCYDFLAITKRRFHLLEIYAFFDSLFNYFVPPKITVTSG